MTRYRFLVMSVVILAAGVWRGVGPRSAAPALPAPHVASYVPASQSPAASALGRLPMQFEVNEGQAGASAKFVAQGQGYNLLLEARGIVLGLLPAAAGSSPAAMRLQFIGAEREPEIVGLDRLPGVVNYFLALDQARGHAGIATYARVKYKDVYPGIDAIFYGSPRELEHDFVVAPGRDPRAIVLKAEGIDSLALDGTGDLWLGAGGGQVRLRKPVIYQEVNGGWREVQGGYTLRGERQFGFRVAPYDTSRPLIIDPVLVYSGYLGGSNTDLGHAIATDAAGNIYITGATNSANFPSVNAVQAFVDSGISCPSNVAAYRLCYDAFVTKLDPTGSTVLYSTYVGSRGDDEGRAIAVDAAGNAYVAGYVSINGDPPLEDYYIYKNVLVFKLTPAGDLGYAAWWGNTSSEAHGIAVDAAGRAYVTGQTGAGGFPVSSNAIQSERLELIDGFISVLDSAGQSLLYSSYLGGSGDYCGACYSSGNAIALDDAGLIYVTGQAAPSFPTTANAFQRDFNGFWKAFVTVIDPTQAGAAGLVYSTFIGGEVNEFGYGIAIDAAGNVVITGSTNSDEFPTTAGAYDRTCGSDGMCNVTNNMVCDYTPPGMPPVCHLDSKTDAFVAAFDISGWGAASLLFSTFVGGAGKDEGYHLALDQAGNAYVTGRTVSPDFPQVNPYQPGQGGAADAFLFGLNEAGSALSHSTFLGGSGDDMGGGVAVDPDGNVLVVGSTASEDFPRHGSSQSRSAGVEAFVVKITNSEPSLDHKVFLPNLIR